MKQQFTSLDLIAYLYRETTLSERFAINHAAESDPAFARELGQLLVSKQQLPQVKFSAPRRVLDAVLAYGKASALEGHLS